MTENLRCNIGWNNHNKILIVEDESLQRHLLREYLSEAGYEVVEAVDGQEAMAQLAVDPEIRVVITDLKMPRMDGFELIRQVRKKQLHYIYILVQTHRDDAETLEKALSLGADDFLRKPVRPVELCLRVAGGFRVLKIEKFEELIFFLTKLAALQSKETGSHLDRMYHFTRVLARDIAENVPELGLTLAVAEEIAKVSPMHDLGKVGISVELLHKVEKLNHEEVQSLQDHVLVGGNLIQDVYAQTESEYLFLAQEIAQLHHERWDGKGYPHGLAGDKIPLCARIVALADAYDAMTSKRSYSVGLSHEEAKREILRNNGKQFDPKIVEAFLRQEAEFIRIKEEFRDNDSPLYSR
ncbi:HD-GYP domain-containing protein [Thiovibrio frasassiensis]|uniref:Response regulator n=1 Tax=Thiovibrio frasassiensis TaxID=2984131 RepID=A0A9X4RLG7_9BACT|nr:response regulator [Thiovibrio frasassiensis]MDG4475704.1 response regulator [Thiovibrio frasassiensis]